MKKAVQVVVAASFVAASVFESIVNGNLFGAFGWLVSVMMYLFWLDEIKRKESWKELFFKKVDELGKAYSDIDRLSDEMENQTRW